MGLNTKGYVVVKRENKDEKWIPYANLERPYDWKDIEDAVPGWEYQLLELRRIGKPRMIWQHKARKKKEKEESLDGMMKKGMATMFLNIAKNLNFSGMSPSKLTLPDFAGMSLEFTNPNALPGENDFGYIKVGENRYKVGGFDNLKFDGVLPVWIHPMFGAMIGSLFDNIKGVATEVAGTIADRMAGKEQVDKDFADVLGKEDAEEEGKLKPDEPEDFDDVLRGGDKDEGKIEKHEKAKDDKGKHEEIEEKKEKEEEDDIKYADEFEELEKLSND